MNLEPRPLVDPYSRVVKDLRISVTDRCNFRCTYCMPIEGMKWLDRPEVLSFEEIFKVAKVAVEIFGFTGIRLTGGEPTVRAQLPVLVSKLASLRSPSDGQPIDLSMTTNGSTLGLIAQDLRDAGLKRINISLDTFSAAKFLELTRRDHLPKVLDGIESAIKVGFDSIKLNIVAIRDKNQDELVEFAKFGRDKGVIPRFIEFMPLDADEQWSLDQVLTSKEIVETITAKFPATAKVRGSEPATRYLFDDGIGEFGVIASVTEQFCDTCDRIRLTADGKIRTCLFAVDEHDLKSILRNNGTEEDLVKALERAVGTKWAGHSIGNVNFIRPSRSMSQIGG